MSERRFKFGALLSFAWLLVMAWVILHDPSAARAMKPNEWGDFFAGAFAPLAFLWLVLGYLQQGQELQLSTKALQLQAEELRNSVQQQKELVEVTRQQVESDREALQLERLARQEAAKPQFVIKNSAGGFDGNGGGNYQLVIQNVGNTATNVIGTIDGIKGGIGRLFGVPTFTRTTEFVTALDVTEPFPDSGATLRIEYFDADGRAGKVEFRVVKQNAAPNSFLAFYQVGV